MPRFEFLWRHAIINTKCTWLHGDPRGFRSRKHRIHSTGDYKMPPPPGEHEGLHAYQVGKSGAEIHIARAEQAIIGCALRDYLDKQGYKALAVAVTKTHAHVLVELPHGLAEVNRIIGQAKRSASRSVEKTMPGSIWSAGGKYKPVLNRDHCATAHDYIIYDQGLTAWTWSFRDASDAGQYGRCRPNNR